MFYTLSNDYGLEIVCDPRASLDRGPNAAGTGLWGRVCQSCSEYVVAWPPGLLASSRGTWASCLWCRCPVCYHFSSVIASPPSGPSLLSLTLCNPAPRRGEMGRNWARTWWVNRGPGTCRADPPLLENCTERRPQRSRLRHACGIPSEGSKLSSFPPAGRWTWTRPHHSCVTPRSEKALLPASRAPPSEAL